MSYIARYFARSAQPPSSSLDDAGSEIGDRNARSQKWPYSTLQHGLGNAQATTFPPPLTPLAVNSLGQNGHSRPLTSPEQTLSASTIWEDTDVSAGTTPRQSFWTKNALLPRTEMRPVLRINTESNQRTIISRESKDVSHIQNPFSPAVSQHDNGAGSTPQVPGNEFNYTGASSRSDEIDEPCSRFSAWTAATSDTPKTIRANRLTRQSGSTAPVSGISPSSAVVDFVYQTSSPVRHEPESAGPDQNRLLPPGWRPRSSVYSQATIYLGDGSSFQMPPSPVPPMPKIAPHWITSLRDPASPTSVAVGGSVRSQTLTLSPQSRSALVSINQQSCAVNSDPATDIEYARSRPSNLKIDTSKARPTSNGYWVEGILTAHLLTPSPRQQTQGIYSQQYAMTSSVSDRNVSLKHGFWSPLSTKDEGSSKIFGAENEEIIMFGLEDDSSPRDALGDSLKTSRSLVENRVPSIINQSRASPDIGKPPIPIGLIQQTPHSAKSFQFSSTSSEWSGYWNDPKKPQAVFGSPLSKNLVTDSGARASSSKVISPGPVAKVSATKCEKFPAAAHLSSSGNSVFQENFSPQPPPYASKASSCHGSTKAMPKQNARHPPIETVAWPTFGGSQDSLSEASNPKTPDEEDVQFYASITGWKSRPVARAEKSTCVTTKGNINKGNLQTPTNNDRRRRINRRKLIRWSIFSGILICVMVILAVVLATTLHTKHAPPPPTSIWVNQTGFPPMPTGTLTVAQPSAAVENAGCVNPSTIWSCALPKEQQADISPDLPDQPNFKFDIRYRNTSNSATSNVSDGSWVPTPAAPNLEDQIFLGNTTDDIFSSRYEGEETPFYITFMSTTQTTSSNSVSQRSNKRSTGTKTTSASAAAASGTSRSISSAIPPPDVDTNGDPAPANLLPYPIAQPLRLYNRGLPTEHYGFYTYFDRSIFLSTLDEESSTDFNGGSPRSQASMKCTWAQTRFLVQIWTQKGDSIALLPSSSQPSSTATSQSSSTSSSVATSASNAANSTTTFSRPGTFPYPVTITLDRHGGNVAEKMIYCYGIDSTTHAIIASEKFYQVENRGFGGTLVNPALLDSTATLSSSSPSSSSSSSATDKMIKSRAPQYGGIDGGTGGCSCQWQNFLAQS